MEAVLQRSRDILGSLPDSPASLLDLLVGLFAEHGYVIVFVGAAGDNLGIPATGDVVMLAGGWLANSGRAALIADHLQNGLSQEPTLSPPVDKQEKPVTQHSSKPEAIQVDGQAEGKPHSPARPRA